MEPIKHSGWDRNVERNCPVCGDPYLAAQKYLERGKQTTCSRKCSYVLRGREKQARVEVVCAVCGDEVSRPASHVKGQHGANFCSPGCHYAGRSLGVTRRVVVQPYQYTEGGRTRLSKAAAHLYASGEALAFPETEQAVVRRLTALGIGFTHQHVIETDTGAFCVDFLFPRERLVLELDGLRAHRYRTDQDAERDRILTEMGFRVRRIPDSGDPCEAVRAVLAALLERTE